MAKSKKKVKEISEPVNKVADKLEVKDTAPVETATLGEDTSNEGGLPLPESAQPVQAAPASALTVKEITVAPQVVGVSDSSPEIQAALPQRVAAVVDPLALVKIRGMRDMESAPSIGKFDFADSIGKESRTGQIVRGKFKNGYIYVVPSYVADAVVEKDWGMRI